MKKIVKLLFVFLLGFMIIPMVHAEDLPTEGVTYFMDYPNGEEEVTLEYDKANDPEEVLIFSGMTDSNGKINLCDWSSTGQLRIVQEVPAGYTTTTKEVKVDLSRDNVASFINYRGLDNPKTGRSILVFLGIIGVVTITILVSRKNKKSLLIIPLIVGALVVTQVKADETCFCIQVKDGNGKALSNVHIDVYAKPNNIEAYPAIIYDANGGKFFDGKDKMYVRLPQNNCSNEDFYRSLSNEEFSYIQENLALLYKDGYKATSYVAEGYDTIPTTLTNGLVLKPVWTEQEGNDLVEINGNGGVINFHGTKLEKAYVYSNLDAYLLDKIKSSITNGKQVFTGYDKTSGCNRINEYGIQTETLSYYGSGSYGDTPHRILGTFYACWNEKPDGIYVNGEAFIGTPNSCFKEADMEADTSAEHPSIILYNPKAKIYIGDFDLDDIYLKTLYRFGQIGILNNFNNPLATEPAPTDTEEAITKVEIIKNGATLVTLTEDDFEVENEQFYILNDDKRPIVMDYLAEALTSCFE